MRFLSTKLIFGIAYVCFVLTSFAFADRPKESDQNDNETVVQNREKYRSSRGSYSRFLNKSSADGQSNRVYLKSAFVDGNLITGEINNRGLLSNADNNIRGNYLSWPKGPLQVPSIFGAFFYIGAEVVDENNQTIGIISDPYTFGNGNVKNTPERHNTIFQAVPRYYNLDIPGTSIDVLVGGISEDVGEDGEANTNDEGEGDGLLQPIEDFNSNGKLDLSMVNEVGWFAITSRRETWPEYWPPGSYPGDDRAEDEFTPGIRAGRWNGEFGAKLRADQETYFVFDDRENDQFQYFPFPDDDRPWPDGRRGLGMKVETRTYQWNARLAEDILITLYDITNEGKDIEKSVVGMLVDPDMGINTNNDADAEVIDDITYTWNLDGRDVQTGFPTGYFGFAFLESPGLSFDGIDNDLDGLIDESQNDGIDNDGDWRSWSDLDGDGVFTNEDVNHNRELDEGEDVNGNGKLDIDDINDDTGFDGIGPQELGYPGPDGGEADGMPTPGEPNFDQTDNDESDQVGLTSVYFRAFTCCMDNDQNYWNVFVRPNPDSLIIRSSGWQEDVAFTYGSGYVEFKERENSAGEIVKETHRYAIALVFGNDFPDVLRNKKTMQIIYDNDYNFTKPPDQPTLTATAGDGKVFLQWDKLAEKSFDPIYKKDFEGYYIYKSTVPSFTDIKTITDGFGNPQLFKPLAIFDRKDNLKGLHPVPLGSELGESSNLGVSYNLGNDSGLRHFYVDSVDVTNGFTYYYAVAAIDQGYHPSFFALTNDSTKLGLSPISPTESPVEIGVDALGRPISFSRNAAAVTPTELFAGWEAPNLGDEGVQHISGRGTGNIDIEFYNELFTKTDHHYQITFDDDGKYEALEPGRYTGDLSKITLKSLTDGITLRVDENPTNRDSSETFFVEGFRLLLNNDTTRIDTAASSWIIGNTTLKFTDLSEAGFNRVPRDFELRVLGENADSSIIRRPVNFQIWDVTEPDNQIKMDFFVFDNSERGILDNNDDIAIVKIFNGRKNLYRFKFSFPANLDSSDYRIPQNGDVFKIVTRKSFDRNDVLDFEIKGNSVNTELAKSELDDIYVVPDPYIAVSATERLVVNQNEGRGDRRIDFVNLPKDCTVKIFTAAGRLVNIINFAGSDENRRASWDLRTKDGLEIAFGVYFYAVEAPGIGVKTGKFAVIK